MPQKRFSVSNNMLAALATVLILISLFNFSIAMSIIKSRQVPAQGMAPSGFGEVYACVADIPQITGILYHEPVEDQLYYYDFNATGEGSGVSYGDNSTFFNITTDTGVVNFTPTNDDVGVYSVLINATEPLCSATNYTLTTFNITNFNDPPYLISIVITNDTSLGENVTYYFPITETIYLYEDTWYNLSLIADDEDLYLSPPYQESLRYGYIPTPGPFELNTSTGNVTFMPVQSDVGDYSLKFHVIDSEDEMDESDWVDITVINVNDPPVLQNKTDLIGGLGANTVEWATEFYYDANATDEDGDTLYFYVDFINCSKLNASDTNCTIFGINETTGVINVTPPFSDVGNYTVNYTVTDGQAWDYFVGSFSVAEWANMPPNITSWLPTEYNVTMSEGESISFSVNITDDSGLPFCLWYEDSVPIDGTAGLCYNYTSEYTFIASYEDSGIYNITIMVSDGQFVRAHEWRLIVLDKKPPAMGPGSYYTSRRIVPPCTENWRCTVWSVCSEDGVQIRECVDLSGCNTTENRPDVLRFCTYTPYPSCFDDIKNCHHGSCEILTDCGGPCASCPTCSDGILNCHANGKCEDGVDCGGPCPPCITPPHIPVCGNSVCESGELYECPEDCVDFWIDIAIFVVIIILLVITSILLYVYRKETVLLYIYKRMKGE
jgi:hypothetical protein